MRKQQLMKRFAALGLALALTAAETGAFWAAEEMADVLEVSTAQSQEAFADGAAEALEDVQSEPAAAQAVWEDAEGLEMDAPDADALTDLGDVEENIALGEERESTEDVLEDFFPDDLLVDEDVVFVDDTLPEITDESEADAILDDGAAPALVDEEAEEALEAAQEQAAAAGTSLTIKVSGNIASVLSPTQQQAIVLGLLYDDGYGLSIIGTVRLSDVLKSANGYTFKNLAGNAYEDNYRVTVNSGELYPSSATDTKTVGGFPQVHGYQIRLRTEFYNVYKEATSSSATTRVIAPDDNQYSFTIAGDETKTELEFSINYEKSTTLQVRLSKAQDSDIDPASLPAAVRAVQRVSLSNLTDSRFVGSWTLQELLADSPEVELTEGKEYILNTFDGRESGYRFDTSATLMSSSGLEYVDGGVISSSTYAILKQPYRFTAEKGHDMHVSLSLKVSNARPRITIKTAFAEESDLKLADLSSAQKEAIRYTLAGPAGTFTTTLKDLARNNYQWDVDVTAGTYVIYRSVNPIAGYEQSVAIQSYSESERVPEKDGASIGSAAHADNGIKEQDQRDSLHPEKGVTGKAAVFEIDQKWDYTITYTHDFQTSYAQAFISFGNASALDFDSVPEAYLKGVAWYLLETGKTGAKTIKTWKLSDLKKTNGIGEKVQITPGNTYQFTQVWNAPQAPTGYRTGLWREFEQGSVSGNLGWANAEVLTDTAKSFTAEANVDYSATLEITFSRIVTYPKPKVLQAAPTAAKEEKTITATSKTTDLSGSAYGELALKASKATASAVTLKWNKIKGVDSYTVYGAKENAKYKKLAQVKSSKTSYTAKKLKKGTYYKFVVVANVIAEDGTVKAVSSSKTVHAATTGGKVTNVKSLKVTGKVSVKKGKTKQLKVAVKSASSKKTLKNYRAVSFESSDKTIATVSKKGKITGKKKGKCTIYVYAQNGLSKKVKVTVK